MKIVSSAQMRDLDRKAIQNHEITALTLMERAGTGVANLVLKLLEENHWSRKVVFFSGKGNNAGDAFVAARLLDEKDVKTLTLVLASFDQVKGEAKENLKKLRSRTNQVLEIKTREDLIRILHEFSDCSIGIDGMVGTGVKGTTLQGLFAEAADILNELPLRSVVAIDIPSGLNPDTGLVEGPTVRADHTLTLGLPKKGLLIQDGLEWAGQIHVLDLGFPKDLLEELVSREFLLTPDALSPLPQRNRISHKGIYGHLFILGGSPGLTGAPCLAALSALRSGAGLVTVGIAQSLNSILEIKLTEPMTFPLPENPIGYIGTRALDSILTFLERCTAVVIGPGLGREKETVEMLHQLFLKLEIPVVIDADGLNALAQDISILKKMKAPVILTPHPGEMARLMGEKISEIQSHRLEIAKDFAKDYQITLVLKGAGTVIASAEDSIFVNVTGNPGMATGGMGDILAGIIGGFLAQGVSPLESAKAGVYLHGICGDESKKKYAEEGLLASDLLNFIPSELKQLKQTRRKKT